MGCGHLLKTEGEQSVEGFVCLEAFYFFIC